MGATVQACAAVEHRLRIEPPCQQSLVNRVRGAKAPVLGGTSQACSVLAFEFKLFGVSFVHAVLHERSAVTSRHVLLVGEVLADVRLVLLTHFIKLLISSFLEAVLYEIFAIVSLQAFVISHIVAGFGLVLLR